MRRPLLQLKKFAILCHRWMGVAFCLLFSWWFVSGIFMMYWDYPEVSAEDRLARSPVLSPLQVRVSAAEAYARLQFDGSPEEAGLGVFDGRPVYRFGSGRDAVKVYADTGTPLTDFPPAMNLRTAAAWAGQPAGTATVERLNEADQWTVAGEFRALRPLWKYRWPNGAEVYVSEVTGEVVQSTTRGSRLGAWLGAIPHWLYFTPLRKQPRLWSRIVIWASGAATLMALSGLVVGLWMYSPSRRYKLGGMPTAIPYHGQKRLHMILGLFFGIVACTWAFSGMLSMEPFPTVRRGGSGAGARIAAALRGGPLPLAAFAAKPPAEALAEVAPQFAVKELELTSFAGDPVYLARDGAGHSRVIPVSGAPADGFDPARLGPIIAGAVPADVQLLTGYDAYYLDRHHQQPLPVLLVRLRDADHTRYYVDPKTARIVGGYSSRGWINRWLYHGLHSINLPWLYWHRPAWDLVVLALMLGGASLSLTSVIIAWQLLRRKLSAS